MTERPCPHDWNDAGAWDRYFASFPEAQPWTGLCEVFHWMSLDRCVAELRALNVNRLWLPGCGTSTLPWLYAACGFDVVATDLSEVAITRQGTTMRDVVKQMLDGSLARAKDHDREVLAAARAAMDGHVGLRHFVHDFRTPMDDTFDMVLNVQAYGGLRFVSRRRAAETFFNALRPDGTLHCHVLNEPVVRRLALDNPLREAGFFVIGAAESRYELEQERQLGVTPHWAVSSPVQLEERFKRGEIGRRKLRKLMECFDALTAEYERAKQAEAEELAALQQAGPVKTAKVLHSTG